MYKVRTCLNFTIITTLLLNSTFLILFLSSSSTKAANILSVAFISSKSHKLTYDPLLAELASRGHNVTVLSPVKPTKTIPNLTDILTIDIEESLAKMPNLFEMREKHQTPNPIQSLNELADGCRKLYRLPQVRHLMSQRFDLIFLPVILQECATGFVHKLRANSPSPTPIVLFSPVSAISWISSALGSPTPTSFVPNVFTPYSDRMSFYERTINFLLENFILALQHFYFKPSMEALYREELNDSSVGSADELLKDASLLLSNSHISMGNARPFLPDIIEVGGMHCKDAKPLPKDLEDFINSSNSSSDDHEFILFSLGSSLQASTMPEKYRLLLIHTFAKLKQKVLWKWETESMSDLPSNVKLSKWLPQQDVLGHPKIKGFISHGGLGSITEAVYHGVPMIAIPMFSDQYLNVKKAVQGGFAVSLEFTELTEQDLYEAINRVVYEPSYRQRVQELSKTFRDQPDPPLARAVFWIEYVLRHNGAPHLRSAARDLNLFQYYSIDVMATLLGLTSIILYLTFILFRFVFRRICSCLTSKKNINETKKKS